MDSDKANEISSIESDSIEVTNSIEGRNAKQVIQDANAFKIDYRQHRRKSRWIEKTALGTDNAIQRAIQLHRQGSNFENEEREKELKEQKKK